MGTRGHGDTAASSESSHRGTSGAFFTTAAAVARRPACGEAADHAVSDVFRCSTLVLMTWAGRGAGADPGRPTPGDTGGSGPRRAAASRLRGQGRRCPRGGEE